MQVVNITKMRAAVFCDGPHTGRLLTRLSERRAGQSVTSRDDHERIFALRLADDLSYRPRKNDQSRPGSGARKSAPVSCDSADKEAAPPDDRNEKRRTLQRLKAAFPPSGQGAAVRWLSNCDERSNLQYCRVRRFAAGFSCVADVAYGLGLHHPRLPASTTARHCSIE